VTYNQEALYLLEQSRTKLGYHCWSF